MVAEAGSESGPPERVPAGWRALLALLRRLPQGALSRAFGGLADVPVPRSLRRLVLGTFARAVGADVSEAELPLEAYPSLDAFFVRRLRPGSRTWPPSPRSAGSPVDGVVGQLGTVTSGRLLQAKGRDYSAASLLGDAADAEAFSDGRYLTLYLSPRHYHRIHAPVAGVVRRARHVPGGLLPVNAPAVASIPELFVRNERLICYLDGDGGRCAVVAVGAYNVGRISADFEGARGQSGAEAWITNRAGARTTTRDYEPPLTLERGADLMAFHLGSTVVLLFGRGMELADGLVPGDEVRVGQIVARPVDV